MKNIIQKITILTLFLGFTVTMDSCKKEEVILTPAEQIIGKWKLTDIENNGYSEADYAFNYKIRTSELNSIYEFKADFTYTFIRTTGPLYMGRYNIGGNKLTYPTENNIYLIAFNGNIMTQVINSGKLKYIYTKQ